MNRQDWIDQLIHSTDPCRVTAAARALALDTNDPMVMDALCRVAVETLHHQVRDVVIDVLKTNPAGACMRFMEDALWSKTPAVRKWALVNLSLLRCRDAKDAVISGLYDVDESVRIAAAMNTGLYDDNDVQAALQYYFDNHRLDLTLSLIADRLNEIRNGMTHPGDGDVMITTVLV